MTGLCPSVPLGDRRAGAASKSSRCEQDLNLRGETPLDFKSNAFTTRPSQQLAQRVSAGAHGCHLAPGATTGPDPTADMGSAVLTPAAHPARVLLFLLSPALHRAKADMEIGIPAVLGKGTGHQLQHQWWWHGRGRWWDVYVPSRLLASNRKLVPGRPSPTSFPSLGTPPPPPSPSLPPPPLYVHLAL